MNSKIARKKVIWKIENFTKVMVDARNHSKSDMREILFEHFDILVNGNKIQWQFELYVDFDGDKDVFPLLIAPVCVLYDEDNERNTWTVIRQRVRFSIQQADGKVTQLHSYIDYDYSNTRSRTFDESSDIEKIYGWNSDVEWDYKYFQYQKILDHQDKYIDDKGTATFIFDIEFEDITKDYREELKRRSQKIPEKYSGSMLRYFNSDAFSDFTIVCRDGLEIPAHRSIIASRSDVFDTMLQIEMLEKKTRKVIIDDIDGDVMLEVLQYIYGGVAENLDKLAIEIVYAAEKYNLTELKTMCIPKMFHHISEDNVLSLLILAGNMNTADLEFECLEFIKMNFNKLSTKNMCDLQRCEEWKNLGYKLILKILKSAKKFSKKDFPILIPSFISWDWSYCFKKIKK